MTKHELGSGVTMMAGLAAYAPRLLLEWPGDDTPSHRAIEGTLVFADVSGFTALSERLERKGKVGAEQMAEILNGIFGELLRVAAGWGGEMLKFGGDAILLFFTGEEHAPRAASAAHSMQRRLADVGRVDTGSGRVRLRMSVGINSGSFDVFRVGGSHVELVIMGPATTTTVEMESAADATEVLLSPATAAAIGEHCLGPEKAGGRLVKRSPLRKPPYDEIPGPPDVDARRFVAPALLPYVAEGGGEPEHRQVTVAFIHIMGVDDMLRSEGPAAVSMRLDTALRHIQERLEEHRVAFLATDVAADGTKIMATAGAPFTTGHDEERMLRALHEVVSADAGLPIRAGVNRGRVFAGDVGPSFRRTYTAMGDPTNTAARVMGRAKPGQLLTLAPVLDRSMTIFETDELEPFHAKGKSEPLVPHSVGGPIGRRQSARRQLPLLGRDAEMGAMRAVIGDVAAGARRALEAAGQAGMGTSRLVSEALESSGSLPAVVARCTPYDETAAYSGVGRLLTALIGERRASVLSETLDAHAPELREWTPLLGLLLDVDAGRSDSVDALDPAAIPSKAAEVIDRLVVAMSSRPTALVLEDAHWCDSASRAVLMALTKQTSAGLLCVTRQPGPPVIEGVDVLEVGPLPPDAAKALVRLITPTALLPQQIDALVERAGGNPLFLSELVNTTGRGDELPESVEAFFAARIDRLDPDDRAALRYAAVVGLDFDLLLVEKLLAQSGRPPVVDWPGLDAFLRIEDDKGRFISVLARDAAYEALPFRQRRSLHQDVGEMLEDLHAAGAEELARHFYSASDHDRTWRYARSAAERAEDRHAYQLAAMFHSWAAEAGRAHSAVDSIDVAVETRAEAEALRKAGHLEEALSRCHVARRLAPAAEPLACQLSIDRGGICALLGQAQSARRWYRDARRLLTHSTRDIDILDARIMLGEAHVAAVMTKDEEAHRLARQAAAAAAACSDARTELGALSLAHAVANRLRQTNRVEQGLNTLRLAEALGDLRQQATVLGNLGVDAHLAGDLDKALDYYERTRDVAERSGLAISHSVAVNNIGEIHLDRQDWARAEQAFIEAQMTANAAGHWYAHVSKAHRGRAVARLGRVTEGRALLTEALESLMRQGAAGAAGAAREVAGWLEQLDELPGPA